jgi:hypothetical protein
MVTEPSKFIINKSVYDMVLKRICYSCDLKVNPNLIAEYKEYQLDENSHHINSHNQYFVFQIFKIETLLLFCF